MRATGHRRAARLMRDAGADAERVATHLLAGGGGADLTPPRSCAKRHRVRRRAVPRGPRRATSASSSPSAAGPTPALLHELAFNEIRAHEPEAPDRVLADARRGAGPRRARPDRVRARHGAARRGRPPGRGGHVRRRARRPARGSGGGQDSAGVPRGGQRPGPADGPATVLDPVVERAELADREPAERLQLGHAALAAAMAGSRSTTRGGSAVPRSRAAAGPRAASAMSALTLAAVALIVADELDAVEPAVDEALAERGAWATPGVRRRRAPARWITSAAGAWRRPPPTPRWCSTPPATARSRRCRRPTR